MKTFFCLIIASSLASASTQPDTSMAGKQAETNVELVTINELPLPIPESEMVKAKRSPNRADDGVSTVEVEPERVRQFFNSVDVAVSQASVYSQRAQSNIQENYSGPMVVKDLNQVKLSFTTAKATQGELIAVATHGTVVAGAWTGVERFYRVAGAGIMRISETDMKATNGKFYMLRDAVNTQVAGRSAISKVFTDGNGQTVEEILWVSDGKLHILTYAPSVQKGRYGVTKAEPHVTAMSLAQALR